MFAQLFGTTGTPIPAVAWYKLDGNALDSSGNGLNGTWSGAESYAEGKFAGSQGASFGGASRIDTTAKITGTEDFTFAAWVKINTHKSAYLVNQSDTLVSSLGRVLFFDSTTFVRVQFGATSTDYTVDTGVWTHMTLVRSAGVATVYYNGDEAGAQFANTNDLTNVTVQIGGTDRIANRNSISVIQDVRVYSHALSPANIARIMTGQDNEPLEELQ